MDQILSNQKLSTLARKIGNGIMDVSLPGSDDDSENPSRILQCNQSNPRPTNVKTILTESEQWSSEEEELMIGSPMVYDGTSTMNHALSGRTDRLKHYLTNLQNAIDKILANSGISTQEESLPAEDLANRLQEEYRKMAGTLNQMESMLLGRQGSPVHLSGGLPRDYADDDIGQLHSVVNDRDEVIRRLSARVQALCRANDQLFIDFETQEQVLSTEMRTLREQLEAANSVIRRFDQKDNLDNINDINSGVSAMREAQEQINQLRGTLMNRETQMKELERHIAERENAIEIPRLRDVIQNTVGDLNCVGNIDISTIASVDDVQQLLKRLRDDNIQYQNLADQSQDAISGLRSSLQNGNSTFGRHLDRQTRLMREFMQKLHLRADDGHVARLNNSWSHLNSLDSRDKIEETANASITFTSELFNFLESEIQNQGRRVSQLGNEKNKLEGEISNLKNRISQLEAWNRDSDERIHQIERDRDEEMEFSKRERNSVMERLHSQKDQVHRLQQEIETLNSEKARLLRDMQSNVGQVDRTDYGISMDYGTRNSLEIELSLDDQRTPQFDRLSSELNQSQEAQARLMEENSKLIKERDEISEQLKASKKCLESMEALENQLKQNEEEGSSLKGKLKFMHEDMEKSQRRSSQELERLEAEIAELRSKLSNTQTLEAENTDLRSKISDAETTDGDFTELRSKMSDVETENAQLRSKMSDMETENAELRSKMSDKLAMEEYLTIKEDLHRAQDDVATMKARLSRLANWEDEEIEKMINFYETSGSKEPADDENVTKEDSSGACEQVLSDVIRTIKSTGTERGYEIRQELFKAIISEVPLDSSMKSVLNDLCDLLTEKDSTINELREEGVHERAACELVLQTLTTAAHLLDKETSGRTPASLPSDQGPARDASRDAGRLGAFEGQLKLHTEAQMTTITQLKDVLTSKDNLIDAQSKQLQELASSLNKERQHMTDLIDELESRASCVREMDNEIAKLRDMENDHLKQLKHMEESLLLKDQLVIEERYKTETVEEVSRYIVATILRSCVYQDDLGLSDLKSKESPVVQSDSYTSNAKMNFSVTADSSRKQTTPAYADASKNAPVDSPTEALEKVSDESSIEATKETSEVVSIEEPIDVARVAEEASEETSIEATKVSEVSSAEAFVEIVLETEDTPERSPDDDSSETKDSSEATLNESAADARKETEEPPKGILEESPEEAPVDANIEGKVTHQKSPLESEESSKEASGGICEVTPVGAIMEAEKALKEESPEELCEEVPQKCPQEILDQSSEKSVENALVEIPTDATEEALMYHRESPEEHSEDATIEAKESYEEHHEEPPVDASREAPEKGVADGSDHNVQVDHGDLSTLSVINSSFSEMESFENTASATGMKPVLGQPYKSGTALSSADSLGSSTFDISGRKESNSDESSTEKMSCDDNQGKHVVAKSDSGDETEDLNVQIKKEDEGEDVGDNEVYLDKLSNDGEIHEKIYSSPLKCETADTKDDLQYSNTFEIQIKESSDSLKSHQISSNSDEVVSAHAKKLPQDTISSSASEFCKEIAFGTDDEYIFNKKFSPRRSSSEKTSNSANSVFVIQNSKWKSQWLDIRNELVGISLLGRDGTLMKEVTVQHGVKDSQQQKIMRSSGKQASEINDYKTKSLTIEETDRKQRSMKNKQDEDSFSQIEAYFEDQYRAKVGDNRILSCTGNATDKVKRSSIDDLTIKGQPPKHASKQNSEDKAFQGKGNISLIAEGSRSIDKPTIQRHIEKEADEHRLVSRNHQERFISLLRGSDSNPLGSKSFQFSPRSQIENLESNGTSLIRNSVSSLQESRDIRLLEMESRLTCAAPQERFVSQMEGSEFERNGKAGRPSRQDSSKRPISQMGGSGVEGSQESKRTAEGRLGNNNEVPHFNGYSSDRMKLSFYEGRESQVDCKNNHRPRAQAEKRIINFDGMSYHTNKDDQIICDLSQEIIEQRNGREISRERMSSYRDRIIEESEDVSSMHVTDEYTSSLSSLRISLRDTSLHENGEVENCLSTSYGNKRLLDENKTIDIRSQHEYFPVVESDGEALKHKVEDQSQRVLMMFSGKDQPKKTQVCTDSNSSTPSHLKRDLHVIDWGMKSDHEIIRTKTPVIVGHDSDTSSFSCNEDMSSLHTSNDNIDGFSYDSNDSCSEQISLSVNLKDLDKDISRVTLKDILLTNNTEDDINLLLAHTQSFRMDITPLPGTEDLVTEPSNRNDLHSKDLRCHSKKGRMELSPPSVAYETPKHFRPTQNTIDQITDEKRVSARRVDTADRYYKSVNESYRPSKISDFRDEVDFRNRKLNKSMYFMEASVTADVSGETNSRFGNEMHIANNPQHKSSENESNTLIKTGESVDTSQKASGKRNISKNVAIVRPPRKMYQEEYKPILKTPSSIGMENQINASKKHRRSRSGAYTKLSDLK